jgi:hypothetical protein
LSTPIRSSEGNILGTLFPCFNEPKKTTKGEMLFIKSLAHLADILIQRQNYIATLKESEEKQRIIFEQIRSNLVKTLSEVGDKFMKSLVSNMVLTLNVSFVFIGEYLPASPVEVRTLAFLQDGKYDDIPDYEVKNTPCDNVIRNQRMDLFPKDIKKVFPDNVSLKEGGVQSHLGITLFDSFKKIR